MEARAHRCVVGLKQMGGLFRGVPLFKGLVMRGKKNAESTQAIQEETSQASQANAKAQKVKTVKMVRDDGKTADVHPDEVANYALGGYKKA